MKNPQNSEWKVSRNSLSVIHEHETDETSYWYKIALLTTSNGYVNIYMQDCYTNMSFIFQGREYWQSMDEHYSDRGLAIVAGKFVKRIIDENS